MEEGAPSLFEPFFSTFNNGCDVLVKMRFDVLAISCCPSLENKSIAALRSVASVNELPVHLSHVGITGSMTRHGQYCVFTTKRTINIRHCYALRT